MPLPCHLMSDPLRSLAVILVATLLAAAPVRAASTPDSVTAPLHGGAVIEAGAHVFETALARDGVHVWFYTDERAPAMAGRAAGAATLKLPDGQVREVPLVLRAAPADGPGTYFCPMHAEVVQTRPGTCEPCGGMILFHQDELFGAIDLAGLDPGAVTAQVRLTGLKGPQKEATFSSVFPRPDGKAAAPATGR